MRLLSLALLLVTAPLFASEEHLRYLPSDTKVVFTLHVVRLPEGDRDSGRALLRDAYKKHLCPTLTKADTLPMSDLDRIVVALPYAGTFNGLILFRGKIDRKKFEQQMNRAAKRGRSVTSGRLGTPAVTVYRCKLDEKVMLDLVPSLAKIPPLIRRLVAPQEVHVTALDDETLIVSMAGLQPLTRALRSRPTKSEPRISADLAKLLRVPHETDTVTLIVMEDSLHPGLQLIADEGTKETFDQFEYVRFHLRGGKATEIEAVVQGKSSDVGPILETKSKRVLAVIREVLPAVMQDATRRELVDKLVESFRVTRKDERVTISGSMTEADAKKFIEGRRK